MSTTTPEQAAYEAFREAQMARLGGGRPFAGWGALSGYERAEWKAATRAGIAAYIEANGRDPVDVRSVVAEALAAAKPRWTERLGPVVLCDHSPAELGVTVSGEPIPEAAAPELAAAMAGSRQLREQLDDLHARQRSAMSMLTEVQEERDHFRAERDDLRDKLAAAVNPTAEDYDNAAGIGEGQP